MTNPRETFATTHWTRVLAARGESAEAKAALSDLCAAYYQPVIAYLCGRGHATDAARELAHEFFARMLRQNSLEGVDPQRGRFRSYLLGAVKHFLQTIHEHESRQKRGGHVQHTPLPGETEAGGSTIGKVPKEPGLSPDLAFDRQWAITVLHRALETLEHELGEAGKARDFEVLKPWLTGDAAQPSQAEAARELGTTEGAIKVAVHRLRKRFREAVKQEIASTLNAPGDLHDELQHLLTALG